MLNKICKTISDTVVFSGRYIKLKSPQILVGAGIVGLISSTVLACKETTKIQEVLDDASDNLVIAKMEAETEEELKKETTKAYVHMGLDFAKLYAPSVCIGAASILCILASNGIMKKRNAALVAAYTAVDKGFKKYRERVVNRFGEEVDKELRYGVHKEKIVEETIDENGKKKKEKKEVYVKDEPYEYSEFARIFDETNPWFQKDPGYNYAFLIQRQNYANDQLRAKGIMFLNEVYDLIGIPPSKAGQVVGWRYYENGENPDGDNFIDFGILNVHNQKANDFVNGFERSIILDFNPDGEILSKMDDCPGPFKRRK